MTILATRFIKNDIMFMYLLCIYKRVLLNRAPSSTYLHPAHFNLHPAHFSLHPALCNTLNNIRTKILHAIGQFPQI